MEEISKQNEACFEPSNLLGTANCAGTGTAALMSFLPIRGKYNMRRLLQITTYLIIYLVTIQKRRHMKIYKEFMYIVCSGQFYSIQIFEENINYFDVIIQIIIIVYKCNQHKLMSELLLDVILLKCFQCNNLFNAFFSNRELFSIISFFCLHVS